MHNGAFATLQQVVEFYNRGGIANENLDPLIKPLNLTSAGNRRFNRFFRVPDWRYVKELVADAFAAPIGDNE